MVSIQQQYTVHPVYIVGIEVVTLGTGAFLSQTLFEAVIASSFVGLSALTLSLLFVILGLVIMIIGLFRQLLCYLDASDE